MSQTEEEFDYERIVEDSLQQDEELQKFKNAMQECKEKRDRLLKQYKTLKAEYNMLNTQSQENVLSNEGKKKILDEWRLVRTFYEDEHVQASTVNHESKMEETLMRFRIDIEHLKKKYTESSTELDDETLQKKIDDTEQNTINMELANVYAKENLNGISSDPVPNKYTDLTNLEVLTEELQHESLELFGNENKNIKKLTELENNIDYLEKSVYQTNITVNDLNADLEKLNYSLK